MACIVSHYSVHLSTATTWRGGENQILLLALGLRARGHKVLVLAPEKSPLLERCKESGIDAQALNICCELDIIGVFRLIRILRAQRPGILHLHDSHAVLPGQLAARVMSRNGFRTVAHRRTFFALNSRWKYQGRIDRIIAISHAVRERMLSAGIPPSVIRVVYSGLDFQAPLAAQSPEVNDFRKVNHLPKDTFLICHAAALSAEKRQQDIIEALHQSNQLLKTRHLPPVHLALAGIGDQEEPLRALVRSRGLEEHVHFLGFIRDLRPLWASSSLAIFASEAEGLCTALIEAQGAGLPAIVTRAGGMVEVVEHESNGVIVEVGDIPAMTAAIMRLHQNPALLQRMQVAARARVCEKFSADAMVEGVLSVYREMGAE